MKPSARARWSELGAVTSAGTLAATVLCCLPFATGIIGASLAAVGARFAPFQPYLVACSLGLLSYSFYQAYRPGATCNTGACTSVASPRRRRIAVWLVALLVAVFLTVNWWASWLIYWSL